MSVRRTILPLLAALAASTVYAQADEATLARIVDEGKNNSRAMKLLNYMCTRIGHRLTSSESLDKAYIWTQEKFKEFGCVNVHLEQWGEWPVGFQRMKSSGRLLGATPRELQFTTPSWTEGTHGRKRGNVVLAPTTKAEFDSVKATLKGAWVLYKAAPPRPPRGRPGEAAPAITPEVQAALDLQKSISEAGILGSVQGSGNELVLTGGNYRDKTYENHPKDVSITIRKSDLEAILKAMEPGKPVQLEFDINQKFIPGPRKHYNVIAEIPGTEKPDEIVIVGGHLDSWDGPGSQGAADNANGTIAAIEAARILNRAKARPKRTIRFILFTGEEQGLFGSREYVRQHAAEMPKISAVFIEDGGANPESGTYGLESMQPMLKLISDVSNKAFPDLPMVNRVVTVMPRGGGSDHVPFNAVGVPAFFWDEKGSQDYNFVHHTQNDTVDLVPEKYLVQSATNEAVAAFIVACEAGMMPRDVPPAPRPAAQ